MKMLTKNTIKPGFWKLGNRFRRQSRRSAQLSEIYMRQTQKIELLDIFDRPTRTINVLQNVFDRPTRLIIVPQNIYERPTRKIDLPDIFDRPTRKIQLPTIFQHPTRKIEMPDIFQRPTRIYKKKCTNIFQRPTRQIVRDNDDNVDKNISGTSHSMQMELDAHNITPCSVVLDKLLSNSVITYNEQSRMRDEQKQNLIRKNRIEPMAIDALIEMRSVNRSIRTVPKEKQIFYHEKSLVNGPIPLNRDTYYDLYDHNKQFCVDDFDEKICVQHYFLTRFHPDQYAGLTDKFSRYIYTSQITGTFNSIETLNNTLK